MREKEDKGIETLALSLSAMDFSQHFFFVNVSLTTLHHESRLHFSLVILKNERLGFFARLDGQKEINNMFFLIATKRTSEVWHFDFLES